MPTCIALAVIILSALGATEGIAQAPPPDPRFGIVEAYVNSAAASEAGAGYTRIIFRWDLIQPDGPADWKPANVPDPFIETELAAGRQVVAVLIGTPAWATADGSGDRKAVPAMHHWEQFVRQMARQYRGRIHHWIIWNEPDVWDVNHPGGTWAGSEEDYFTLLKTAYLAIKDVDPTMQVHMAGLTYFWDQEHGRRQYLDRLLDVVVADPEAPAHNYYFDAVIYHLYFKPRQTLEIIGEAQGILEAHGIQDKPIWINETNAPPSEDAQEPPWATPRFRISLEEQSAFVIQEFALAFAGGASRVEFYKLRNSADHPESIEPYGLLRADDSRRPAFTAYQVVTTYLRDFRAVQWQHLGDVYVVTFDRGDSTTTILWTTSRSPTRFAINAIAPQATLVDEQGNTSALNAVDGAYMVELPAAICTNGSDCFIGGAPRLLVEAGSPAGRPSLLPDSTPTATIEAEITVSSTITTTLTPTGTAIAAANRVTPSPQVTPTTMALTPTKVTGAQEPLSTPSPEPTSTPIPPITPLTVLTPSRCLILIIVGMIVFTITYGLQVALWWRRRR